MTMRLTFVPDDRHPLSIEGGDAAELLDAWNNLPAWKGFDPAPFRQRIVYRTGAQIDMPAPDEEILDAIVAACSPQEMKLERNVTTVSGLVRDAQRPSTPDA